jgi:phosphatidylserine/phosphatidylglycerophosphate/cardiolipin synthase-like enzyme|tara:strand:- start:475 stop:663 length:189 start_codon:yes stop_codon:yes gene_type:complete
MNNWREYEEIEEDFNKVDIKSPKTKKKKTWKQINEEKQRQVTKKQWQKKRRVAKKVGKDDGR